MMKRSRDDYEKKLGLTEQKQSFIYVQESTTKVPIVAEMRNETLQVSNVKLHKESLVQVEKVKWRPKTRVKNKLRLNKKKILNPKLRKEKVTMI